MPNYVELIGPDHNIQSFNFDDLKDRGANIRVQEVVVPSVDSQMIQVHVVTPNIVGAQVNVELVVAMVFDSGNGDTGRPAGAFYESVTLDGGFVVLDCDGASHGVPMSVGGSSPVAWLNDDATFLHQLSGIYVIYTELEFVGA